MLRVLKFLNSMFIALIHSLASFELMACSNVGATAFPVTKLMKFLLKQLWFVFVAREYFHIIGTAAGTGGGGGTGGTTGGTGGGCAAGLMGEGGGCI